MTATSIPTSSSSISPISPTSAPAGLLAERDDGRPARRRHRNHRFRLHRPQAVRHRAWSRAASSTAASRRRRRPRSATTARSLTVATFNVENLDPGDGAARFAALANAIANNLNAPDIICIEEMQDNNGAAASGGTDASTTWQMLVDALNLATGANYQWVDQEPQRQPRAASPAATSASASSTIPTGSSSAISTPMRRIAERRAIYRPDRRRRPRRGRPHRLFRRHARRRDQRRRLGGDPPLAARRVHLQRQHRLRHRQPLAGQGRLGRVLAVQPESRGRRARQQRLGAAQRRSPRTSIRCST